MPPPRLSEPDHYAALGLTKAATNDDIKQAYRALVRQLHPDKGGDAAAFAAVHAAYALLSNPKQRAVYDATAKIRSPAGAEEALVDELAARWSGGVDPLRQLVLLCGVCGRPATAECWTCGLPICPFCTRRQHWRGEVPLHWPLVNAPGHMLEVLGRKELEQKRLEDGAAYLIGLPGYRPREQEQLLREFLAAAAQLEATGVAAGVARAGGGGAAAAAAAAAAAGAGVADGVAGAARWVEGAGVVAGAAGSAAAAGAAGAAGGGARAAGNPGGAAAAAAAAAGATMDPRAAEYGLTRFFMWSQTPNALLVAVYAPTGGGGAALQLDITPTTFLLGHQGHPPVVRRHFSGVTAPGEGVDTWSAEGGRLLLLRVTKAVPGQTWRRLFKGDSDGARCTRQPYRLLQLGGEVTLEVELPRWVVPQEDVQVSIGRRGVQVAVDGVLCMKRTYWWDTAQHAKRGDEYQVVDLNNSSWHVEKLTSTTTSSSRRTPVGDYSRTNGTALTTTSTSIQAAAAAAAAAAGVPTSSPNAPAAPVAPPAAAAAAPHSVRQQQVVVEQLLTVHLARPEVTVEEQQYKKGVRQDHLSARRCCPCGQGAAGYAFFLEEEDEFGLMDALLALEYVEQGAVTVPPRPWQLQQRQEPVVIWEQQLLPQAVQQHLAMLQAAGHSSQQPRSAAAVD